MSNDENQNAGGGGGSWWGWVDKVKQTTQNVVSIYTEDLKEFTKTISNDTKHAIKKSQEEETRQNIKSSLGKAFGFVGTNEEQSTSTEDSKPRQLIVDRRQGRILALQNDVSTFTVPPTEISEFTQWKKDFKLQAQTDQISHFLAANEKLREIHTSLVPAKVSYSDFWERFFWKLHKLNEEENKREALIQRAAVDAPDEEEVRWEDDHSPSESKKPEPSRKETEQFLANLDEKTQTQQTQTQTQTLDSQFSTITLSETPSETKTNTNTKAITIIPSSPTPNQIETQTQQTQHSIEVKPKQPEIPSTPVSVSQTSFTTPAPQQTQQTQQTPQPISFQTPANNNSNNNSFASVISPLSPVLPSLSQPQTPQQTQQTQQTQRTQTQTPQTNNTTTSTNTTKQAEPEGWDNWE